jgi:hypothetical protein
MTSTGQLGYEEAKPLSLYPNPNVSVKWGDQTWEEMMIGWFLTCVHLCLSVAKFGFRTSMKK